MVETGNKCINCGSYDTLVYKGHEYWYNTNNGKLCRKCYLKTRTKRRMRYKRKSIVFPFTLRTGFCMIKDCDGTDTDRHHIFYCPVFPVAGTVELCSMHHREENVRQEDMQDEYNFDWNRTHMKSE